MLFGEYRYALLQYIYKKAFHMVERELMEFCLLKNGVDCQFYQALTSLYCDTELCLHLGDHYTVWFECRSSVRQHYLPCLSTTSPCTWNISTVGFILAPINRTFFCMQIVLNWLRKTRATWIILHPTSILECFSMNLLHLNIIQKFH